ncbi:RND transporter [Actinomycetospora sp. TBRC 11914]|uniref:RND transporter n=1 Tax=Actinomycetospora sp. TBRC 11914 TaxID=2729387 RepID=UPI00145D20A8|nr:RND transporter [Actinomycetospora sp. TBRC 11914]NMO92274.1 RND transporter [Actinomycetospora sp. TBRC 11914]
MRMSWITRRGARDDAGAPPRVSVRERAAGARRRALHPSRRDLVTVVAGLLVAVFLGGGLAQVRVETGVDSFLPANDPSLAQLNQLGQSFGGDPIVVLLENPQPRALLQTAQLPGVLALENQLGNEPDTAALYGPVGTLNNIAGQAQLVVAELLGRRDGLTNAARQDAQRRGASPADVDAAGAAAQAQFDSRYAPAIIQALPTGLPTLKNPRFVENVVFDSTGGVKARWHYVIPNPNSLAILVRPRAGLDQAGTQRLVDQVTQAAHAAALPPGTTITVSGVPTIVAGLGQSVDTQIPVIGAIAVVAIGLVLFLVPWTRRRRRLLPLAVTLLATGMTVAGLGWIHHPLSLGVLAFLPVLLGLGSYYPTYFAQRARSRVVLVVAAGSALSFATLALTPLAFVRDLGITLAVGIAFAVALGALLVRRGTDADDGGPREPVPAPTASRRVRHGVGAGVLALALAGWALLATMPLQTNIQDLARGLPAMADADHVQDVIGTNGELNVVLRATDVPGSPPADVRSPEAWQWMEKANQQIVVSHGDTMNPVLSLPGLLDFLGPTPTADQIQAGLRLMPDSLTSAVVRGDGQVANMSYGVSLDDLGDLATVTGQVKAQLPPPPPGTTADLTGLPTVAVRGYQVVSSDRYLASVAGVVAAGLVLALGLRRRVDALRAVSAAVIATGGSLLLLWATGTALSPLTVALGSLTAAVGCEFTVMVSQSVRQSDRSLRRAVALAAGTSAIGYAVLAVSPLALMREFGLLLAASVGLSYAAALFVVWVWPPSTPLSSAPTAPDAPEPAPRAPASIGVS